MGTLIRDLEITAVYALWVGVRIRPAMSAITYPSAELKEIIVVVVLFILRDAKSAEIY